MKQIKEDENKYNEWLENNKIIQSKSYYKKVENQTNIFLKLNEINVNDENINK